MIKFHDCEACGCKPGHLHAEDCPVMLENIRTQTLPGEREKPPAPPERKMTEEELDLIEARECAAQVYEADGWPSESFTRKGDRDNSYEVRAALLAIKRARKRQQPPVQQTPEAAPETDAKDTNQ